MIVIVELIGTLRTLAKAERYRVELEEGATISTLMRRLRAELFADKEHVDESNLLIMTNGKEISVLNGLQTGLENNDIVTLIPVSHGG